MHSYGHKNSTHAISWLGREHLAFQLCAVSVYQQQLISPHHPPKTRNWWLDCTPSHFLPACAFSLLDNSSSFTTVMSLLLIKLYGCLFIVIVWEPWMGWSCGCAQGCVMAISRRERFVLWIKDKKRKTVRDGKTLDCFSSVTARGNLCLKSLY